MKAIFGYLVALIMTLVFPPLGVVAGLLAFWYHWESNNSQNQKVRREVQDAQDARKTYERNKWRLPLTEKTKQEYKKAEQDSISAFGLTDHQTFLNQQIKFVESKFELHGANLFCLSNIPEDASLLSVEALGGSDRAEKIADELITSPARYVQICSAVGRGPLPELVELWKAAIIQNQNHHEQLDKQMQKRRDAEQELAYELLAQIQKELDAGYDWKSVLENAQQELKRAGNKTLSVSRMHGVWEIRSRGSSPRISISLRDKDQP